MLELDHWPQESAETRVAVKKAELAINDFMLLFRFFV